MECRDGPGAAQLRAGACGHAPRFVFGAIPADPRRLIAAWCCGRWGEVARIELRTATVRAVAGTVRDAPRFVNVTTMEDLGPSREQ